MKPATRSETRRTGIPMALLLFTLTWLSPGWAHAQELPEGFEQLLPRGRIASIDDPTWTTAEAADIPDDAIVMGVLIDGEPRAFSINLLNAHEVVNDTIGETPYAAVW